PAAHSMDTTWWAVDEDGHVAEFCSGEMGAVPTDVTEDSDEVRDLLVRTLAAVPGATFACDDLLQRADGELRGHSGAIVEPDALEEGVSYSFLLWVRSKEALKTLSEAGLGEVQLPVKGRTIVWLSPRSWAERRPLLPQFRQWQEAGLLNAGK